mmetsp:Transcript_47024/g.80923  ORF Transcript_47024/g.80923 Transcript_47024/m.80923 type:complete len:303 (+) Transcript_47024:123-1031(+)
MNHRADGLPLVHDVEGVPDLLQGVLVGDELVHLQLARQVLVHVHRQHRAPLGAPEGGAGPAAAGDELERARGDLHAAGRHADDAALAPALVAALEAGAHGLLQADALEGVVHAAGALFHRHVHDHLLDGAVVVRGVHADGGPELLRPGELARVDVHGDDLRGARGLGAHDHREAHAAQPEDGDLGPRLHLHRVHHGAVARGDPAPKQAHLLERGVVRHLGHGDLGHHRVLAEGGGAHEVVDRLALAGEAAAAIGHDSSTLGAPNDGAQIGLARSAELASLAFGNVQRNHFVPWFDGGDPLAN